MVNLLEGDGQDLTEYELLLVLLALAASATLNALATVVKKRVEY
jgi:hypothetical protein